MRIPFQPKSRWWNGDDDDVAFEAPNNDLLREANQGEKIPDLHPHFIFFSHVSVSTSKLGKIIRISLAFVLVSAARAPLDLSLQLAPGGTLT